VSKDKAKGKKAAAGGHILKGGEKKERATINDRELGPEERRENRLKETEKDALCASNLPHLLRSKRVSGKNEANPLMGRIRAYC